MNPRQAYPHLAKRFDLKNFDQIIKAIATYYSDIFNLDLFEKLLQEAGHEGPYFKVFALCVNNAKDLFTPDEVAVNIHKTLSEDTAREIITKNLLLCTQARPSQIGFLEKTAMGVVKPHEPVTFIDMYRCMHWLTAHANRKYFFGGTKTPPAVINLACLGLVHNKAKQKNQNYIVNFNQDLKKPAKWGAIIRDRDENKFKIYCETPLLEAEKSILEKALGHEVFEYIGASADNLISTGYSALAWI